MIPAKHAQLYVSASTHAGMRGKNNEDRYAVSAHTIAGEPVTPSLLAVLCDGVGGHQAGEVAAEIAVETISKVVADSDAAQPVKTLEEAVLQAHQAVQKHAAESAKRHGMASTCVCVWIIGDKLYSVSVGDSRLHLIRGGRIQQITTDHTWIQEVLELGALTPEQAKGHPNAHVIQRHLGSQKPLEPDFRLRLNPEDNDEQALANQGTRLLPGDFLVLCSDGLTDLVEKQEILNAFQSQERKKALNSLIDLANQRGGHDNITIVALEVPSDIGKPLPQQSRRPSRKWLVLSCLVFSTILAIAILLLIAGFTWFWSKGKTPSSTPTSNPTPIATQRFPQSSSLVVYTHAPLAEPLPGVILKQYFGRNHPVRAQRRCAPSAIYCDGSALPAAQRVLCSNTSR